MSKYVEHSTDKPLIVCVEGRHGIIMEGGGEHWRVVTFQPGTDTTEALIEYSEGEHEVSYKNVNDAIREISKRLIKDVLSEKCQEKPMCLYEFAETITTNKRCVLETKG